jgi:hypothetical protein
MRPGEVVATKTGPRGTASLVHAMPIRADESASLASWFLELPGSHPAWSCYLLSVIHLRQIPGVHPPVIKEPDATHELTVLSLDPTVGPRAEDLDSWRYMLPVNIAEQFHVDSDADARELARLAADALVLGILDPDPDVIMLDADTGENVLGGDRVARNTEVVDAWRSTVAESAAHLRGEHA